MKKLNENEWGDMPEIEESEHQRMLQEIQEDKYLEKVKVPKELTEKLYAQIEAIEAAKAEVESEERMQELNTIIEGNMEERFIDLTPEELAIYKAGLTDKQREMDKKIIRRKKRLRAQGYLVLIAVIIMIMAAGTVGVGESIKWLSAETTEQGTDDVILVESDADIIVPEDMSEIEAYEYVMNVLGVTVISLPTDERLDFQSVEKNGEQLGCNLFYFCEGTLVSYCIVNNINAASYQEVQTGELIEEYEIDNEGNIIEVQKYEESDGKVTCKASFACNNVYYSLVGVINEELFKEILENLYFY